MTLYLFFRYPARGIGDNEFVIALLSILALIVVVYAISYLYRLIKEKK